MARKGRTLGKIHTVKPIVSVGVTTNIKTWDGLTYTTGVKVLNGLARASIKTIDGLS